MSNQRKIYCTISILLSFGLLSVLMRYVGNDYKWVLMIAMLVSIRLNIYLFTPKKNNAKP